MPDDQKIDDQQDHQSQHNRYGEQRDRDKGVDINGAVHFRHASFHSDRKIVSADTAPEYYSRNEDLQKCLKSYLCGSFLGVLKPICFIFLLDTPCKKQLRQISGGGKIVIRICNITAPVKT